MTASNDIDSARSGESLTARQRALATAVAWVVGAALVRALLSSLVPLLPDETYYWLWTRRLEAGYFDHPPGIALLIAFGTSLFGDTHTGVRFGPMVAALFTHVAAVVASWQLAGRGTDGAIAAARAAAIVAVVPLATLGLVIATPDAVLFATAMVALLAVERALAAPVRSRRGFGWWTLAGVALGGAFVAKYTAVLLPAGLVAACVVHPALRSRFREAGPWWASAIAIALFAPVVVWNYLNQWISFRFQLGHGFGATVRGSVLSRELELLGGQVGLASPILFVLMAFAVWMALRDGWRTRSIATPTDVSTRRFAFAVIAVVPLIVFAISATRKSVEANWPALMYPAAMLLLATDSHRVSRGRWWRGGVGLAAMLIVIVSLQAWRPLLPLAPRKDPIARAHGWQTLAAAVDVARHDAYLEGAGNRWVAADRYQDASELAFHLPDQPTVFSLNLGGRANQFDLWDTVYDRVRPGDALVAVFDDNPAGDSLGVRVGRWFGESRPDAHVVLRRGDGEVAHRRVWLYRNASDTSRPPAHVAAERAMNGVSFGMLWAIAIGGATGSVSRYLVSLWMTRAGGAFPLGTLVINVAGSFLIGLFARAFSMPDSNPVMRAALTIGFCGGFTTFSTFSAEFVALVQEGRTGRAVLYAVASVVTSVLAVVAGLAVGQRFFTPRG